MSYVVLARKYRPQTFEEVVGQNPVSQTLLNALESGRIAHAYVFSGPRGVGKTTTARILAKCLNCEKGPTRIPCNVCDACRSISETNSLDDVMEIDGASNRGIEQIRELRESAKYAPSRSRYRIYIIDEAHQITKDAFGALLKTLEEPPPHVVFMMATTEVQKIPAPILSRCQRFTLRPIDANSVLKHLKEICAKENVKVDDDALANIVRFVEGSLRDALSLLDQAIVFSPGKITLQAVRDLLGLLPMEMIHGFADTVSAGEPAPILKAVNAAVNDGIDLTQLGKDLQNHYHALLLAKAGVEDPFKIESAAVAKAAAGFDFTVLERNIRLLSRALEEMRHSETPRAIFEIYALRMGQKVLDAREMLERVERLANAVPAEPRPAAPASAPVAFGSRPAAPAPVREPSPAYRAAPRPIVPTVEPVVEETPATVEENVASTPSLGNWADFANDVAAVRVSLASALDEAKVDIKGNQITLSFPGSFHADLIARSMDILKPILVRRFGPSALLETRVDKTIEAPKPATAHAPRPTRPEPPRPASAPSFEDVSAAEAAPETQAALKHFPGAVKREKKPS